MYYKTDMYEVGGCMVLNGRVIVNNELRRIQK